MQKQLIVRYTERKKRLKMRQRKEVCNNLQEQHREGQVTGRRRRRDRKRNRSDKEFMVHNHRGTKIERSNRDCKVRKVGKAL